MMTTTAMTKFLRIVFLTIAVFSLSKCSESTEPDDQTLKNVTTLTLKELHTKLTVELTQSRKIRDELKKMYDVCLSDKWECYETLQVVNSAMRAGGMTAATPKTLRNPKVDQDTSVKDYQAHLTFTFKDLRDKCYDLTVRERNLIR